MTKTICYRCGCDVEAHEEEIDGAPCIDCQVDAAFKNERSRCSGLLMVVVDLQERTPPIPSADSDHDVPLKAPLAHLDVAAWMFIWAVVCLLAGLTILGVQWLANVAYSMCRVCGL